jgi:DNA-binding response OmpR family regulator
MGLFRPRRRRYVLMGMTASTDRKHATILLVEDDPTLGDAFARVLRGAGYEVWLTAKAEEGLEKARLVRPHAIIVDFRMPLVNGLGFLYRLRSSKAVQSTPVAVVTGDTALSDEVRAQLQELGADLRMKPIMPNDLVALVRGMVGEPVTELAPETPQRTVW